MLETCCVICDVNTKELLGIRITDERVGDSKEFENLIEQAEKTLNGRKIALALADGAHDNKDSFNYLKKKGITSGIKVRKNASTRARGSPYRAQCVRELKRIGYNAWKEKYCYGMRWTSEGFFSAVKRIFGEDMRATSREGMIQEVKMKFIFYNTIAHAV
ncbi:MAG: transposase [Theionarchaea archaeon]|nr:transposase [Theionarchaea archaeon]